MIPLRHYQRRHILEGVRHLLSRDHEPLVTVGQSTVTGAGRGVFATMITSSDKELPEKIHKNQNQWKSNPGASSDRNRRRHHFKHWRRKERRKYMLSHLARKITNYFHFDGSYNSDDILTDDDTSTIPAGTPLCLYPGIYTPPLPPPALHPTIHNDVAATVEGGAGGFIYMANADVDTLQTNAYILNLPEMGGYIDGSISSLDGKNENPSAVGHLINHPNVIEGKEANVALLSFAWKDVLARDEKDHKENEGISHNESLSTFFSIPNTMRADGSPWYLDTQTGELMHFDCTQSHHDLSEGQQKRSTTWTESSTSSSSTKTTIHGHSAHMTPPSILAGATYYAVRDIQDGEELFFDYALRGPPYPEWAKGWYVST